MTTLLSLLALGIAVAAGARSTWSPCGRSMLSTITPMGERGRGHAFGATAAWFVLGSLAGGLTLGAVDAGLAAAMGAAHLGSTATGGLALGTVLVAAASDARVGGWSLPIHRRQVNERWLDGYRSWVYGLGFGWQIGSGLATYVMTAGVYLVVAIGAVCGRPWVGLSAGAAFGVVRGLAVLLGRRLDTPSRLAAFHLRFDSLDQKARSAMVLIEIVAAVGVAAMTWLPLGAIVAVVALATWAFSRRRPRVLAPSGVAPWTGTNPSETASAGGARKNLVQSGAKRVTMSAQQR